MQVCTNILFLMSTMQIYKTHVDMRKYLHIHAQQAKYWSD
jgi:hypothetical protein